MAKPVSQFRKVLREVQLVLSAGVVALIGFSFLSFSVIMHLEGLPIPSGPVARGLEMALLGRGALLLVAPALCFLVGYVLDLNPYRLGFGVVAFVELSLQSMQLVRGAYEEMPNPAEEIVPYVLLSALAGYLAALAAQKGVALGRAAQPAPQPAPAAGAPAPSAADSFAEQMREAQERAKAQAPGAAPEAAPAPAPAQAPAPAEAPAPAPTGTEPKPQG